MTGSKPQGLVIQNRDRKLLSEVAVMRIIDREQAKVVAGFGSTTRMNTRLLALTRAGLLRRFFTGTILGGRKAFYTLSPKGAALVDAPLGGIRRPADATLAGDRFLEHQWRVNEIYLTVKCRPIPVASAGFRRWISFSGKISPATPIVPDGYFELNCTNGIRAMFLEVDQGTEPLRSWQRKVQAYLHLAVSGEFERLFHHDRFRVLVTAAAPKRLQGIRATVARSTDKIFWFSTFESIEGNGFWSRVWLRPQGDESQTLVPSCATATTATG